MEFRIQDVKKQFIQNLDDDNINMLIDRFSKNIVQVDLQTASFIKKAKDDADYNSFWSISCNIRNHLLDRGYGKIGFTYYVPVIEFLEIDKKYITEWVESDTINKEKFKLELQVKPYPSIGEYSEPILINKFRDQVINTSLELYSNMKAEMMDYTKFFIENEDLFDSKKPINSVIKTLEMDTQFSSELIKFKIENKTWDWYYAKIYHWLGGKGKVGKVLPERRLRKVTREGFPLTYKRVKTFYDILQDEETNNILRKLDEVQEWIAFSENYKIK